MLIWLGRLLDRLFAVAGALLFMQLPQFFEIYQQRLSGHVQELSWQIQKVHEAASLSKSTLAEYIQKFLTSSDPDFARQGAILQQLVERYQQFSESLKALQDTGAWLRPFYLLTHFHTDVAEGTLHNFHAGLVFSWEGLIYAFVGVIFGYSLVSLLRRAGRALFPRRKKKVKLD